MKNTTPKERTLLVRVCIALIIVGNILIAEGFIVGPGIEQEKKRLALPEHVMTVWNTEDKAIKLVVPFESKEKSVEVPFGVFKHLASSGAFAKGSAIWTPVYNYILYWAKVPDDNGVDALYVRSMCRISYDDSGPIALRATDNDTCRWSYAERNGYVRRFWSYLLVGAVSLSLCLGYVYMSDLIRNRKPED